MVFEPPQPQDAFEAAGQVFGGGKGFQSNGFETGAVPSASGLGTRQGRLPNERIAVQSRKLIHWLVPEGPVVQMYINPQSIVYSNKKGVSKQRTKGGFVVQYWGEELGSIKLSGTTGTSGIEGINVLRDIYRNEQLAIDPFALFMSAKNDQSLISGGAIGAGIGGILGGGAVANTIGGALGGMIQSAVDGANPNPSRSKPTLAQLAFTVEMYWDGAVYRGFFEGFNVTEGVDNLGMFNYDIDFTVTQHRGMRQNSFAWQRSATSGPSNSDPQFGTPYSYRELVDGDSPTPRRAPSTEGDILSNITDSFGSISDIF